ncbi:DNA polymerase III subunit delta [Alkanindiges sp. WGS2144]|uniref:DNA polymerase III subunit delta n=1 Tax=Alkanindiges sp. WGS2144 TaxID=3366808 RepID=UPI0037537B0E
MRLDYRGALKRIDQANGAWLIHGNETLLEQNLLTAFRQHWQAQAIERQRFDISNVSDWRDVFNALSSLSLFADKLAVEAHGNIKPDASGIEQLQQFIQSPADNVLLIVMPRQDASAQKTKFYQNVDANGVVVNLSLQNAQDRLNILQDEARQLGIQLQQETWQLLLTQTENNLFAAQQSLCRLSDLYENDHLVSPEDLHAALTEQSRFSSFELADAALQGDCLQAVKILNFLIESGEAGSLILWALAREMRLIMQLFEQPGQYQKFGIWQNKQHLYQQALKRISGQQLMQWPALLHRTDQAIKGLSEDNSKDLLLQLTMALCGHPLFNS